MKTIGIIGGLSWESTLYYYKLMNERVSQKLGGLNSIEALIHSLNFARLEEPLNHDDWETIAEIILESAKKLEVAGASFLLMASNAIHKVVPTLEPQLKIPLLHIVDPTAAALKKAGHRNVGLLGTKVTMEEPFYKERLHKLYEIEAIVPERDEREYLHRIIFDELAHGELKENSRQKLQSMIVSLKEQGAEAIILGCTELTLLIQQEHAVLPLFDTAALHVEAAVKKALQE